MPTHTIRLCELIDPRSEVDAMGLSPPEQLLAFQILGHPRRPTDNDVVEAHLTYIFERSPSGRSDRYSEHVSTLYTSLEEDTARAEMRYYSREQFFKPALGIRSFTFSVIAVKFYGRLRDIREICSGNKTLREGVDTVFSQRIASLALQNADAITVRSVRYNGGNQATISRSTVSSGGILGEFTVEVLVRSSGRYTRVR